MTPATNSDDMRNARPIAEGSEADASGRGRPLGRGVPLAVELRLEALEPRGKIAVGMLDRHRARSRRRVVTAHGENPRRRKPKSVPGNPPKPGAP